MSTDISTQYTKQQNKECGRKGYGMYKIEKITNNKYTPKPLWDLLTRKIA